MKLSNTSDLDMLDLVGGGDLHENEAEAADAADDDKMSDSTAVSGASTPARIGQQLAAAAKPKKKKKVMESWDDELSEGDADAAAAGEDDLDGSTVADGLDDLALDESEKGLRNVYKAMVRLKAEFDEKFKAMWA